MKKCIFSRYGMYASLSGVDILLQFKVTRRTASLVVFLSIMDETGSDLPPLDVNPGQSSQESALSLPLDSKLHKKFVKSLNVHVVLSRRNLRLTLR